MNFHQSFKIIRLKKVDSTNAWAKKAFADKIISDGVVVVADTQTDGRGQVQTKWHDEPGKNLLATFVLNFDYLPATAFFKLNEVASLALIDVLKNVLDAEIKWPNDIWVGDKKIAGILIETVVKGKNISSAFIGVGCNLNQVVFPDEIQATSVFNETAKTIKRDTFLDDFLAAFSSRIDQIHFPELLQKQYLAHLKGTDTFLKYRDSEREFKAKILKVEQDGRLVLQVQNEPDLKYYQFKEIELIGSD